MEGYSDATLGSDPVHQNPCHGLGLSILDDATAISKRREGALAASRSRLRYARPMTHIAPFFGLVIPDGLLISLDSPPRIKILLR